MGKSSYPVTGVSGNVSFHVTNMTLLPGMTWPWYQNIQSYFSMCFTMHSSYPKLCIHYDTPMHCNGEFTESCHSSLRKSEEMHGLSITRQLGTPIHQQRSIQSLTFFDSKRAGFTPPMRIGKKNLFPHLIHLFPLQPDPHLQLHSGLNIHLLYRNTIIIKDKKICKFELPCPSIQFSMIPVACKLLTT